MERDFFSVEDVTSTRGVSEDSELSDSLDKANNLILIKSYIYNR